MKNSTIILESGDSIQYLEVITQFEIELQKLGYLKSKDKEGYKYLFEELIIKKCKGDLVKLYDQNKVFLVLDYPSTQLKGQFLLKEVLENCESKSLKEIYDILTQINSEFKINTDIYTKYMNSVSDDDFSNKSIYRVLILAHLFIDIAYCDNIKKNLDIPHYS